MVIRKLLVVLLMIQVLFLAGCWSSREINTLGINIAMGIDKSEIGYLLTMQIINPRAMAASKSLTMESPVTLYSEEGKDLEEIMKRLSTKTGRTVYNSHLRIVVINEDIAKEGIKDILDYFARYYQFRLDFNFVVARGATAKKVLSILQPLGLIPGIKLYDSLKESEQIWAPTKSTRIIELVNDIVADGKNPVLTGVEVTQELSDNKMPTNSTDSLHGSGVANRTKYFGLGAFRRDRLAGWLDEDESKGYNYITGNIRSTVGYAKYGDKVKITFEVVNAKSTVNASFVNGKLSIDVEIKDVQNVSAVEGEFDVSKEENEVILNKIAEERIKEFCEKTLYKTQNELKTDIFGFGEVIHRKYPKLWEKIKGNWNNEFVRLPVNITVKAETKQLGQITKPFFMKEQE